MYAKNYRKRSIFEKVMAKIRCSFFCPTVYMAVSSGCVALITDCYDRGGFEGLGIDAVCTSDKAGCQMDLAEV